MAVVIESFCVVFRCEAVARHWPDGLEGLHRDAPNRTFCSDGSLCRIAFMQAADARAWVARLVDRGFTAPTEAGAPDLTLYDDKQGSWFPCEWLQSGPQGWDGPEGSVEVHAAWLRGEEPGPLAVPDGFAPARVQWVSAQTLADEYERVSVERGVETWRHRQTGEQLYIGRPEVTDGQRLDTAIDALLRQVLDVAGRAEPTLTPADTLRLEALLARADELGAASPSDPRVVLSRGVACRSLGRWPKAEAAFRQLTQLSPEFSGGWLDLTWALAEQGKHAAAVVAGRRAAELEPDSVPALGNLAASLMQNGELDEAAAIIDRALEIDPTDTMSAHIRAEIQSQLPPAPWWKRLFGR